MKDIPVPDPLSTFVLLPEAEKEARGLTWTPREIQQQPETWLGTWRRLQSIKPSLDQVFGEYGITENAGDPAEVILTGAGTSDYIGRALCSLLQRRWGCNVRAIASTDLLTDLANAVLPEKRYVLISFSRSGESSEGVAVLSQSLERLPRQIRHIVITCNERGQMAKLAGVFPIVLDDAVNDRGLAMTSSFTNMVIAGQALAFHGASGDYEPILNALVRMGRSLLGPAAALAEQLAKHDDRRVCFLGSGALRGVAQECALKVLELNAGRIATLAESFLGVRHGPLSFLNQETLVCAFLSGKESAQRYELDLLGEIRSKRLAKDLLVVSPSTAEEVQSLADHVLALDAPVGFPDDCRPPVDAIVGQLLALFFAIRNGIRPDTPSAGAISRVVSHVKIYPAESEKE